MEQGEQAEGEEKGMSKQAVRIVMEAEVIIPDEELDDILAGFRKTIQANASADDVRAHIAWNVIIIDCGFFVEGIGLVKVNGAEAPAEDTSIRTGAEINYKYEAADTSVEDC